MLALLSISAPAYSGDQEVVEEDNVMVIEGSRLAYSYGRYGGIVGRGFALGLIIGAGSSSGDLFQAAETVDTDSDPEQCTEANPIIMATGNKVQYETDFVGKEEFPLSITRYL